MRVIKNNLQGFSLLEILLVVAVGATFILASLKVYTNVNNANYVQEQARTILMLKEASFSLYAGTINFPGLNNAALIGNGLVPDEYVQGTNEIIHPNGTSYTVHRRSGDSQVVVTILGYERNTCGQVILQVAKDPHLLGVYYHSLGHTSWTGTTPMTPDRADYCINNTDPSTQQISFFFGR